MAFWMWKDLYNQADTGDVDRVTATINKYTDSYERRKEHFKKIEHLVV